MGGRGSGVHWAGKAKKITEKYPSLDVRRLQRGGMLRPGKAFPYHWTSNGERAASINVKAAGNRVTLSYQHRGLDGEWRGRQYAVQLEWTACNYGGKRPWFRCPTDECGRRVALLYGGNIFACRRCHQLAYPSQRKPAYLRALSKAQGIRQALGSTEDVYDPFPEKPKWMRLKTYEKLRNRYDDEGARSWPNWIARRVKSCSPVNQGRPQRQNTGTCDPRSIPGKRHVQEQANTNAKDYILDSKMLDSQLVFLVNIDIIDILKTPTLGAAKLRAIDFAYQRIGCLVDSRFIPD